MENSRTIHMSEEVLSKLKNKVIKHPRIVAGVVASTVLLGGSISSLYIKNRTQNIYGVSNENESLYDSYSMQLEDMLDIDISYNDEKIINKLDKYRECINDYNNTDSYARKYEAFSKLAMGRHEIEDISLRVAKEYLSVNYGGKEENWTLSYDGGSNTWVAHDDNHSIDLYDEVRNLADAIGSLQSIDPDEVENPDKFIKACDLVIMNVGIVTNKKVEVESKEGQKHV